MNNEGLGAMLFCGAWNKIYLSKKVQIIIYILFYFILFEKHLFISFVEQLSRCQTKSEHKTAHELHRSSVPGHHIQLQFINV